MLQLLEVPTSPHPPPWVIVLAGGEGRRLAPLTAALYGRPVPKQFAVLDGRESLLRSTLMRALGLTVPERVLVVVSARHRDLAEDTTCDFPGVRLVTQPMGGGTALGMLLPLVFVHEQDPDADVVFLPSDHHFAQPIRFIEAVKTVLRDPERGDHVVLLGAEPSGPHGDFGWIVPHEPVRQGSVLKTVRNFCEKPPQRVAEHLMSRGGVLSTFITIGSARAFLRAFREHLPRASRAIGGVLQHRKWQGLRMAFMTFGGSNFSRDVLEKMRDLRMAKLPPCGWSDLGTPERVLGVFGDAPHLQGLKDKLPVSVSGTR